MRKRILGVLSFNVKGVDVIKRDAGVVQTTMSSIDDKLIIIKNGGKLK